MFDKAMFTKFIYWIREREAIRRRKDNDVPRPWTKDAILQKYRFCNVDRNDDAVTLWIHSHWLHVRESDPHLWFAMVVARLLNLPASLAIAELGVFKVAHGTLMEVRWRPDVFLKELKKYRDAGNKVFNAAYIVSTNGRAMDKLEYITNCVLTPMWERRNEAAKHMSSLGEFHTWLMSFDGMGSFMAAQVVADLKYSAASALHQADDFHTWAAPGPGSKRGMSRLLGNGASGPMPDRAWINLMSKLYEEVHKRNWDSVGLTKGQLTAQNLQNCLCEFDKYVRAESGEGEPKQIYKPAPWTGV